MKALSPRFVLVGCLASVALTSPAAAADASGHWLVSGKVASFAFTLSCAFQQVGATLKGVCSDGATNDPKIKGGRAHTLTAGHVEGDTIAWTYQSSFLLSHFAVAYSGVRRGDQMSGTINVQNRTGTFTARRAS